jgi:hypothetical protein
MWGLLIQAQIDGTHGKTELLRQIVAEIVAEEKCHTHPAGCPCKLPQNPWVYKEDVEALAPLKLRHSPNCQCAGFRSCAERNEANKAAIAALNASSAARMTVIQNAEAELAANPQLKVGPCRCDAQYSNISCSCLPGRIADAKKEADAKPLVGGGGSVASPHTRGSYYTHNVDTCACGTCYKSRVDSGTEAAYAKKCKEAADAVMAKLEQPIQRQELPVLQRQNSVMGILQAATNADAAIGVAMSTTRGGNTNHPDFAKALFAAMGTPHDSTCPHGMPFYACMPCSH